MIDQSGIGTVIQEVVPRLLAAPHHFVLLGDPEKLANYVSDHTEAMSFQNPIYSIGEQISFPRRLLRGTDVLLCPHYNIPVSTFSRIVVIVHDLAHLVLPQFFSGMAKRLYAHLFFRVVLRNAAMIVSPSEFTRKEILTHVRVAPKRVITILNGPGRSFGPPVDMSVDRLARYDVVLPYILAVGNVKPHKNLEILLKAFFLVKKAADPSLKLVITGQTFESDRAKVRFLGSSCEQLRAEDVVLTGRVSDEDMGTLYHNASLHVVPSLYEGFGLTPLEAVRFGTLPLVADAAALSEVVDDPDLRFDPKDPKDLANKIIKFLREPELLHKKLSEQRRRMERFSWDTAAKAYLRLLENVGVNNKGN
ncbi:MAG: glycosyltransferase family 4 protein [Desulfomonile tiedjei]|uniref:Glycosyltransferase family 4 protein n=1 Tax=Desulfomonile tiedjei TaxID=2358 RepID=A0A9D6Z4F1_9BACT|nr:glycosyltransferase family 4 protein [Desulfomonile tiedjei]